MLMHFEEIVPLKNSFRLQKHCRPNTKKKKKRERERDALFIIGDYNAEIGSQELPGVTGKFGLGIQNETGKG